VVPPLPPPLAIFIVVIVVVNITKVKYTINMGIQGQYTLLFKSKEINFDDILYFLEQHPAKRRQFTLTPGLHAKVTIDALLLAYKY
jgi:hypothetical protein